VVAPGRARRPGAPTHVIPPATEEELASCPFCGGREERTPPETLALGREAGGPNTPGWQVRVVPNLYPALERQEVVVHSPRHARSLADLRPDELRLIAAAWSARAETARADGLGYLHALVNEGRAAGASLAHSHSQLTWMRDPPPAVAVEATRNEQSCVVCALLADELGDGSRVVSDTGGLAVVAAFAGRLPYELLLAPRRHPAGSAFPSELLPPALELLGDAVRRLHAVEGAIPLNAWLHDGGHWHFEVVTRMSVLAGLELGAGVYVNTVQPEEAAARLREAL
jgi:UDPglucose--hexose-1-phosphate uridylyltransferase